MINMKWTLFVLDFDGTYDNEPEDESNYVNPDRPIYEMKKFKLAYGMSSKFSQDKHCNGSIFDTNEKGEGCKTLCTESIR